MQTELTQAQNLQISNYILYNEERFLIEDIQPNKNNKHFLIIYTSTNKKIELPKEYFITTIIKE